MAICKKMERSYCRIACKKLFLEGENAFGMKMMKTQVSLRLYPVYFLCFSLFLLASCGAGSHIQKTKRAYKDSPPTERKVTERKPAEKAVLKPQQQQVVSAARSYMGVPYKWGGTSRAGMDCSGLLITSFRTAQIELPRTSADQSKYGKKVSLHELQPGDLVFFAAKKGRGKITHVGLVTEVRGKKEVMFIHSSSSLGVVENNLYSDYYRKIFIKAQRPF